MTAVFSEMFGKAQQSALASFDSFWFGLATMLELTTFKFVVF